MQQKNIIHLIQFRGFGRQWPLFYSKFSFQLKSRLRSQLCHVIYEEILQKHGAAATK
jgi:hypothetical protein